MRLFSSSTIISSVVVVDQIVYRIKDNILNICNYNSADYGKFIANCICLMKICPEVNSIIVNFPSAPVVVPPAIEESLSRKSVASAFSIGLLVFLSIIEPETDPNLGWEFKRSETIRINVQAVKILAIIFLRINFFS
jgi:hypothetical protein